MGVLSVHVVISHDSTLTDWSVFHAERMASIAKSFNKVASAPAFPVETANLKNKISVSSSVGTVSWKPSTLDGGATQLILLQSIHQASCHMLSRHSVANRTNIWLDYLLLPVLCVAGQSHYSCLMHLCLLCSGLSNVDLAVLWAPWASLLALVRRLSGLQIILRRSATGRFQALSWLGHTRAKFYTIRQNMLHKPWNDGSPIKLVGCPSLHTALIVRVYTSMHFMQINFLM